MQLQKMQFLRISKYNDHDSRQQELCPSFGCELHQLLGNGHEVSSSFSFLSLNLIQPSIGPASACHPRIDNQTFPTNWHHPQDLRISNLSNSSLPFFYAFFFYSITMQLRLVLYLMSVFYDSSFCAQVRLWKDTLGLVTGAIFKNWVTRRYFILTKCSSCAYCPFHILTKLILKYNTKLILYLCPT